MCQTKPKAVQRVCCVCENPLYGRSDKVFCDLACKNRYHSEVRKNCKTVSAETIKVLHKNYQILTLLKGDKANKFEINKLTLERLGFNFDAVTGIEFNNYGCKMHLFEFYWYYSPGRNLIVARKSEQSEISPFVYRRWELHLEKKQEIMTGNV